MKFVFGVDWPVADACPWDAEVSCFALPAHPATAINERVAQQILIVAIVMILLFLLLRIQQYCKREKKVNNPMCGVGDCSFKDGSPHDDLLSGHKKEGRIQYGR